MIRFIIWMTLMLIGVTVYIGNINVTADSSTTQNQKVTAKFVINIDDFIDEEDINVEKEEDDYFLVVEDDENNRILQPITKDDYERVIAKEGDRSNSVKSGKDEKKIKKLNKDRDNTGTVEGKGVPNTATNIYNTILVGSLTILLGVILYITKKRLGDGKN